MISLEEIRQTVATTFKTLHDANYGAVPVNWPNFYVVDTEHMPETYVSVQLSLGRPVEMADVRGTEAIVKGELLISFLRREGAGLTGSSAYSDMLLQNICFKKLSGIYYQGLRILSVSPHPGVVGEMNVIAFCV